MKTRILSLSLLILLLTWGCDDASNANNANNANNTNNTNNTNNANNINNVDLPFAIVDTAQESCFGELAAAGCVGVDEAFGGQDAQYLGNRPSYADNGDGTVTDNVTGLMWVKTPDLNADGVINVDDKLTWTEIQAYVGTLNAEAFAGHTDWRLPTIKELYSLIDFRGTDPSNGNEDNLIPFIDDATFGFDYGDTAAGERTIDSQYASGTLYVSGDLLFGVNFADGRIKGYGLLGADGNDKTFLLLCVRGNPAYGVNDFVDNGDGTVSDRATGLMWSRDDSGAGMTWEEALAFAYARNAEHYLGYSDWRVPNIKELHSIVDYARSPDLTGSPALDPVFNATSITNEAGELDWPYVWSSTTHASSNGMGSAGSYVSFGRALGYMNNNWVDVHGAGAQRSDPKDGDPADYPTGFGPQGDAIRILNFVRLVRGGATWDASVLAPVTCGDGTCDGAETAANCPQDCVATTCGDGTCEAGETSQTCPADCTGTCGDGVCDAGEDAQNCAADCQAGPVSCTLDDDCDLPGACPDDAAIGCTCEATPMGTDACIPNCVTADDCPAAPGVTLTCNPQGLCVPGQ